MALASEVGVPAVARLLRQAGFTTLDNNAAHYGLGLTLGNAEVRLDEMIEAYAMFARGGINITTTSQRGKGAKGQRGNDIEGQSAKGAMKPIDSQRVVSERTAFFIADILSDDDARSFIFGRGGSLEFPFPVAAKTGTSQAYRDNWAIGFSRDVTVGVWVGNFDRTPMHGSSGVMGAGPIFHEVMLAAVERYGASRDENAPVIAPTNDVRRETLCAMSGLAAGDACPTRVEEWVPKDAQIGRCTWHHASDEGLITVWPDEYRSWAKTDTPSQAVRQWGNEAVKGAQSENEAVSQWGNEAMKSSLQIANPLGGATYMYDPTLRAEFQTLKLRALGAAGDVTWEINGARYGTSSADRALEWPLSRGVHQITAIDSTGARAQTRITVR